MILQSLDKTFRQLLPWMFLTISVASSGQTPSAPIPFDTLSWDLTRARVSEYLGRNALSGTAFLKDTILRNGVIEFDMVVTGQRSYPGVIFRMASDGDYERIYFRPHLPASFSNVVQYVGTFNSIDSWQLYTGEDYTASAALPENEWVHVKLEILGCQARVTLRHDPAPILLVRHLAHGDREGKTGLIGPADGTTFFSNFRINHEIPSGFPPETGVEIPFGITEQWQMSPVFNAADIDPALTPEEQGLSNLAWKTVNCRPDGIVDLSRYISRRGSLPELVYLKTTLQSDKDTKKLFSFGYSDMISIFLNGQFLFGGNSAYTSRDPSFQGIVGLNDYINLPLKKGSNELIVALTESFVGWGLVLMEATAVDEDNHLSKKWEINKGLRLPESAVWDPEREVIYLSNFYNDGREFISRISTDGNIIDTMWVEGIVQPSGMCMFNDRLYVVGRMALVEIDPESETIVARYRFPEPGLPNDVSAGSDGSIYITDSRKNTVYRLSERQMEVWIQDEQLGRPNGILVEGDYLLVGTSADGCVKKIHRSSKLITTLVRIGNNAIIDGLTSDGKGGYLISDFNGKIYRLESNGNKQLLLDTTAPEIHAADFLYIPGRKLLVVPSLYSNKLTGYHLE